MVAVRLESVTKTFGGHVAVDDLSLRVPAGSIYGFIGPNGSGKTTTLRMIMRILHPDRGEIRVLEDAGLGAASDRVGYLPEERGLYKKMQVRRLLRFLAELKGVTPRVADARITEWMERLGLRTAEKDWGLAKVDDLSRGMQQKVQFIGTLLHDPELVVLDEPFSGLDPINAQALKDTVVELRRSGKTVIFSTHLMDNAERLCDAVCIISRGEKVLDGQLSEVKKGYAGGHVALAVESGDGVSEILGDRRLVKRVDDSHRFFEIELADGGDAQELLRRIVQSGARIQRFELVQPSLHQIFLERVGAAGIEDGLTGMG